jgi:hypothetical protein
MTMTWFSLTTVLLLLVRLLIMIGWDLYPKAYLRIISLFFGLLALSFTKKKRKGTLICKNK